jgi:Mg2+ and Co2+ transporter CorA
MPFKAYYLSDDGELRRELTQEQIVGAYESGTGLLWVDFTAPNNEDGAFMERTLGFHHLAVEDCLSRRPFPRSRLHRYFSSSSRHRPRGRVRHRQNDELALLLGRTSS